MPGSRRKEPLFYLRYIADCRRIIRVTRFVVSHVFLVKNTLDKLLSSREWRVIGAGEWKIPALTAAGEKEHRELLEKTAPENFEILHYGAIADLQVRKGENLYAGNRNEGTVL